jgi:hypothetical protein
MSPAHLLGVQSDKGPPSISPRDVRAAGSDGRARRARGSSPRAYRVPARHPTVLRPPRSGSRQDARPRPPRNRRPEDHPVLSRPTYHRPIRRDPTLCQTASDAWRRAPLQRCGRTRERRCSRRAPPTHIRISRIASCPSCRRNPTTHFWRFFRADGGGRSSHRALISESIETTDGAASASLARRSSF